jgi:2-polyprenyl-3-methyl-5-hydroxy-6-metoxy-1,4-benzoquinol methylase
MNEKEVPWKKEKEKVESETQNYEKKKYSAITSSPVSKMNGHLEAATKKFIEHQVMTEPYWFQKIEVLPGLFSPGWSEPETEKLPFFGLPEDLSGLRILDIGCAEGYFSFEAEKRGAREVIAIDSSPDSVRRFNIVKSARQSSATAYLCSVYDLDRKKFGTFDLVLFYGVFYHLKHPQLALEKIADVCTGQLLFQTHIYEEPTELDSLTHVKGNLEKDLNSHIGQLEDQSEHLNLHIAQLIQAQQVMLNSLSWKVTSPLRLLRSLFASSKQSSEEIKETPDNDTTPKLSDETESPGAVHSLKGIPCAKYHPYGIMSGRNKEIFDPTVFWLFNSACCVAMLDHVGFNKIETISDDPQRFVLSAEAAIVERGYPVNQSMAPWC